MPNEKKSQADIEQILMGMIRKTAGCQHITGVTILNVPDLGTNWKPAFTVDGSTVAPAGAYQVGRALQLQFEGRFPPEED